MKHPASKIMLRTLAITLILAMMIPFCVGSALADEEEIPALEAVEEIAAEPAAESEEPAPAAEPGEPVYGVPVYMLNGFPGPLWKRPD